MSRVSNSENKVLNWINEKISPSEAHRQKDVSDKRKVIRDKFHSAKPTGLTNRAKRNIALGVAAGGVGVAAAKAIHDKMKIEKKAEQLESRKDRLVSDAKSGAKVGAGLYGAHAALGGATLGGALGGKKMAAKQAVKFGIAGGLKGAMKGAAAGGLVGLVRSRKEKNLK
jgi:hypothetical protein